MTELMRILLDADTLLEFLLNRSKFIGKVEYLAKIFGANSSIQLYLSKPGLDKIVSLQALNEKESEQLVTRLKKRIKILRVTKAVAKKARSSSAIDYESVVEIHLAIKANIGAIVTHKPSDFSSEELSIITLSDLQQRKHLEDNLSKNIKDLPAVFVINSEQISNLDKAFYHLPSYTGVKSLEPKESSHQLDLTCSSEKVSIPSLDDASLRSTHVQSLEQIFLDAFSQPLLDRSTAQANTAKLSGLAGKSSLDALKASIDRDKLSMRSFARSTAYIDVTKFGNLGLDSLTCKSFLDTLRASIDRDLSITSFARSTAYIDIIKSTGIAIAPVAYESPFDKVSKIMLQTERGSSLAIEKLSIKSPALPSFAQIESSKFGGLGGKLIKDMLQAEKASSLAIEKLSIKSPALQSLPQLGSTKFGSLNAIALKADESLLDTLRTSINQALSITSFARSTAYADIPRSNILASVCLEDKKRLDDERMFFNQERKRLDDDMKSFFMKEKKRLDDERMFYSSKSVSQLKN